MKQRFAAAMLFFVLCMQSQPSLAESQLLGVDLSYVNEMDDCGAVYRVNDRVEDAYRIFRQNRAQIVRLRLWHEPDWTNYSTLTDVERSIRRAKKLGMQVLLDFHYSDDWADPYKQIIPRAWANITDTQELAQTVYRYTKHVLDYYAARGLMPDMVQVGNEINSELMVRDPILTPDIPPINWARNAVLLNAGIKAVRDAGRQARNKPKVMLHIAQPENVEPWFNDAIAAGVTDFDMIGLSYYPTWSTYPFQRIGDAVRRIRGSYNAEVMVVETAYPWTLDWSDNANNILNESALIEGYPATIDGQRRYMIDLTQSVIAAGGLGTLYWEPAWVSTGCSTRWGVGSHWENATFFDFHNLNNLHAGIDYLSHDYKYPVKVAFSFKVNGLAPEHVYFASDLFGDNAFGVKLQRTRDNRYYFETAVMPGQTIRYQLYASKPFQDGLIRDGNVDTDGYVSATIDNKPKTLIRQTLSPQNPS